MPYIKKYFDNTGIWYTHRLFRLHTFIFRVNTWCQNTHFFMSWSKGLCYFFFFTKRLHFAVKYLWNMIRVEVRKISNKYLVSGFSRKKKNGIIFTTSDLNVNNCAHLYFRGNLETHIYIMTCCETHFYPKMSRSFFIIISRKLWTEKIKWHGHNDHIFLVHPWNYNYHKNNIYK